MNTREVRRLQAFALRLGSAATRLSEAWGRGIELSSAAEHEVEQAISALYKAERAVESQIRDTYDGERGG